MLISYQVVYAMKNKQQPLFLKKNDKVILFDGICKLCHGWAKFIIKYDKKHIFKLATVQSKQGQALLQYYNMPIDSFDTMVVVDDKNVYFKSDAFFQVIKKMPFYFRLLLVFMIIPRPVRDWVYDRIALNRYQVFGQLNHCLLPNPDHENRFLK